MVHAQFPPDDAQRRPPQPLPARRPLLGVLLVTLPITLALILFAIALAVFAR